MGNKVGALEQKVLTTHEHITELISRIRESFTGSIEVYTCGSCFQFCNIMAFVYPGGEVLYDGDHAIFQIENRSYDIKGEVLDTSNYLPISEYRDFSKFLKYRALVFLR